MYSYHEQLYALRESRESSFWLSTCRISLKEWISIGSFCNYCAYFLHLHLFSSAYFIFNLANQTILPKIKVKPTFPKRDFKLLLLLCVSFGTICQYSKCEPELKTCLSPYIVLGILWLRYHLRYHPAESSTSTSFTKL